MRLGQPSETARRVAAQRLTFERVNADYGHPAADDHLAADVAADHDGTGGLLRTYLEARTRFFDAAVVGAIERGTTQIVVAGAGYDGRSLRYAKPGVHWFEVDHPATQADKQARLARLDLATDHVRFVAADFTVDDVAAGLRAAGLDSAVTGLFLLEGVAVYLERSTLESLLRQLRHVAAPASRLVVSLSTAAETDGSDDRRRAFGAAVGAMGEPVRSAVTPDEAGAFLEGTGWRQVAPATTPERAERMRRAGFVSAEPA